MTQLSDVIQYRYGAEKISGYVKTCPNLSSEYICSQSQQITEKGAQWPSGPRCCSREREDERKPKDPRLGPPQPPDLSSNLGHRKTLFLGPSPVSVSAKQCAKVELK